MIGQRIVLFRLSGIAVCIDASWIFLAMLMVGTFGFEIYPTRHPDLAPAVTWLMALATTVGIFASIVVHEMAHALVARHYGVETKAIQLFLFGGLTETSDEPPHPEAELLIALAGPFASFNLAGWMGLLWLAQASSGAPDSLTGVLGFVVFANLLLGAINLVPAFPLDGGRVLRAILWFFQGDLAAATRVTSNLGGVFGLALAAVGAVALVSGYVVTGVWWILFGLFVRGAARVFYQRVLMTHSLAGEKVRRFMQSHPIVVPRSISIHQMVDEFLQPHPQSVFPVVDGERLVGQITPQHIRALPADEWDRQSVGAVADRCREVDTVSPDADARAALSQMNRARASQLMVVEGERLVGILLLRDLLAPRLPRLDLEGSARATG